MAGLWGFNMPIDSNLPTMVHLYLELIDKLLLISGNLDSGTLESKMIKEEIEFYFAKIRHLMDLVQIEET